LARSVCVPNAATRQLPDFESHNEALALVAALGEDADFYKVGLQLLTEAGLGIVQELVSMRKHIFLDLKIHEIPNSVTGAVSAAGRLGVCMMTVHASGGLAVLRAAAKAAEAFPKLKLLAITVITSLTDSDLPAIGLAPSATLDNFSLIKHLKKEYC
jgi:orotidine-5'-phosphate decarboxylase